MARLRLVGLAVVLCGGTAARADEPFAPTTTATAAARLAREAAQLADTAREVRDLLYYLSDPRGFQYDYYQLQTQLERDPILGALATNLVDLYRHRSWELKVQAQTMADTATPASAAVGAGVSWDAPLCRLFEAQGSAQGFYQDGGVSAAAAWGVGACLPLPFDTIEAGYRGRRQVRRSLLAVPIVDGDRASGDTIYTNLRFYRWLSRDHQVDVAPMRFQFDWARTTATSFQSWVSIAPAYWARRGRGFEGRDQSFEFMRVKYASLGLQDDVSDPGVVVVSPLVLDGVRLGDAVAVGADVGWQSAQWPRGDTAISKDALYLDLMVTGRIGPTVTEVHASAAMQPTYDDQVLDEQRLTAGVDFARTAAWARLDGFASRVRLRDPVRTTPRVWTYGAGADATLALTSRLFLYARVEGARNLIVDALPGKPATGVEVRATLGVTAELRHQL